MILSGRLRSMATETLHGFESTHGAPPSDVIEISGTSLSLCPMSLFRREEFQAFGIVHDREARPYVVGYVITEG